MNTTRYETTLMIDLLFWGDLASIEHNKDIKTYFRNIISRTSHACPIESKLALTVSGFWLFKLMIYKDRIRYYYNNISWFLYFHFGFIFHNLYCFGCEHFACAGKIVLHELSYKRSSSNFFSKFLLNMIFGLSFLSSKVQ